MSSSLLFLLYPVGYNEDVVASTRAAIYVWHHKMESHMYRTVKNRLKGSFRATLSVLDYLCLNCYMREKLMSCVSHCYFNVYENNETSTLIQFAI